MFLQMSYPLMNAVPLVGGINPVKSVNVFSAIYNIYKEQIPYPLMNDIPLLHLLS